MAVDTKEPTNHRISDAGEHIGGARKDWNLRHLGLDDLASLTPEEAGEVVTKDAIWPKPDYAALIADGMDARAAALVKVIRDRLAAKPALRIFQLGTRELRDAGKIFLDYVTMVGHVRDVLLACRTAEDIQGANNEIMHARLHWGENWRNNETRHMAASIRKGKKDPLYVTNQDLHKADLMLRDGWPNASLPGWRKGLRIDQRSDGFFAVRSKRIIASGFETEDALFAHLEAEAKNKSKAKRLKEPKRPHLDKLERVGLPDHRAGRDISSEDFIETFGFRGCEFGNWLPDGERQQVLNLAFDAFHDLADVLGWQPEDISLGGTLAVAFGARGRGGHAAHYESGRRVVNVTRLSGAGSVGHEFGHSLDHWCGEVGRDEPGRGEVRSGSGWHGHTNDRAQFLDNLSDDETAAWNKVMAIMRTRPLFKDEAINAIRGKIVALETQVAEVEENRNQYLESTPEERRDRKYLRRVESWLEDVRGRVLTRLEGELERVNAADGSAKLGTVPSDYITEARKLSGKSGDYWLRPTELFARAFECMVFDRLVERSARSGYLVHGVEEDRYVEGYKGNPYPVGAERERINAAVAKVAELMGRRLAEERENRSRGPQR